MAAPLGPTAPHRVPISRGRTDPISHPRKGLLPSSLSGTDWWASVYFVLAVIR